MRQLEAMECTLEIANRNRFSLPLVGPFSHDHYQQMLYTMSRANPSEAKLGRWLGWMQGGLTYSMSFGDPRAAQEWLEVMKGVNKSCV